MPINVELFWAKVDKNGPVVLDGSACWLWTGSRDRHGYGQFRVEGRTTLAHRVSWLLSGKELPELPLMLDHLCRTRACVNHDHLRVATNRENQVCGIGPIAINAAKSRCVNGHELDGDSVYIEEVNGNQRRKCRICLLTRANVYRRSYRDVERKAAPSATVLRALINDGASWMSIARSYGVSDVAVRKWAKKHGLI